MKFPINVNLDIDINKLDSKILKKISERQLLYISNEVYLLDKGVRNCAWIDIPLELVSVIELAVIKLFQSNGIKYWVLPFDLMTDNEIKGHLQILLYKYEWQKTLFKAFINKRDSLTGDYIFGKLLGYSDESINEFLIKNNIES